MKELLYTMEADVGSLKIEKVEVTSDSAIALVTGVKKQDYAKMNFMDVRSSGHDFCSIKRFKQAGGNFPSYFSFFNSLNIR